MSYQVLARKWRPRVFREMVGQEHVLKALINALDHNRLHHAYLFTGTRGVGKTTIARILAKCLNCEVGVSSEPCDQCAACCEINEGRFVDLIEVDAASRTKVEDTRELLDNVQYAPTKGRYKVYLIDEVHMLSGHSFNALLKTLEEPPPHVKFLLATTDPQKLPVTILSRCLQFNLKNMSPERIVDHLEHILEREMIPFEASALWQLGRSADGSMRDALSLTDQAIAFGNGKVTEADVASMLGAIDQRQVYDVLQALAASDGPRILQCVDALAEQSPDYGEALASLISILHRIAIAQVLPETIDNTIGDRDEVLQLARQLPAEDVQLFYQTALMGRRDLPLAPEPRGGFEMVLLRMLAFRPQGVAQKPASPLPSGSPAAAPQSSSSAQPASAHGRSSGAAPDSSSPQSGEASAPAKKPEASVPPPAKPGGESHARPPGQQRTETPSHQRPDAAPAPRESARPHDERVPGATQTETAIRPAAAPAERTPPPPEPELDPAPKPKTKAVQRIALAQLGPSNWNDLVWQLPVGGVIQNTVRNCQLVGMDGNVLQFVLDERNSTLYDESHQQRLADILSDHFGDAVRVMINVGQVSAETPAAASARMQAERQAQALSAIQNDPLVKDLISTFSATLKEDSVTPLDG
ncbi:DNA polymerase III subunit gamma/tau [Proteobacteria bacterium 005FR1]|nr:DNA polymerase III subunit gamma/tau [Proteobacteria bacterium 005FR1]